MFYVMQCVDGDHGIVSAHDNEKEATAACVKVSASAPGEFCVAKAIYRAVRAEVKLEAVAD